MLSLDVRPFKVTPLRDHHHHPSVLMLNPKVLPITPLPCSPCQTTHSNTSSSIWLLVWQANFLYAPLPLSVQYSTTFPLLLSPLPPHRRATRTTAAGCRAILLSPSVQSPGRSFGFPTPFSWSIGLCLVNESEVVWTVVDSLLEGQLPHIPLIYSSLHWLMERRVMGQPFIVEEAWPENK